MLAVLGEDRCVESGKSDWLGGWLWWRAGLRMYVYVLTLEEWGDYYGYDLVWK